ncbi:hypothetical protein BKA91DRAFT_132369 [Yarrowia lipolytica]|nr:hypothetical protein BKA91DRAFT_132369 [Yarrowia lipolytica]KAE8171802.1 hypothetical protein BKA90DRAFT_138495 [Yarrowia lipolytica]RMI98539.1 hypothetical protein BD777DRAFT_124650 [Yarrowia lipolytica]
MFVRLAPLSPLALIACETVDWGVRVRVIWTRVRAQMYFVGDETTQPMCKRVSYYLLFFFIHFLSVLPTSKKDGPVYKFKYIHYQVSSYTETRNVPVQN